MQDDSVHKFNSIPAFILPRSENIYVTNGCVVKTYCMSACNTSTCAFNFFGDSYLTNNDISNIEKEV